MDEKQNRSENIENPIQTEAQNNKSKKTLMSLSTFIILILLIVIVIMGIYIYKQNQAINQTACVIDPLKSSNVISKKQNTITETPVIENTVEENIDKPVPETIPVPEHVFEPLKVFTEKESEALAKETLDNYYSNHLNAFQNSNIGPMPNILVILGLEAEESINQLCANNYDTSSYIRSNTKYNDFKSALLEYMSEDYFNENYSQYTNINDNVGFCNCVGGYVAYELHEINFKSREDDIYTFNIIIKDLEMYEHAQNPDEAEYYTESDYLIEEEISFKQIDNDTLVIHKY